MNLFTPDQMTRNNFKGNTICHFEIRSFEVQEISFDRIDKFISDLRNYKKLPRQKVLLSFADYNDDERELIYISEVVKYTKMLISRHPYLWYYTIPFNSEFFFLVILLDEKNHTIANVPLARKFHLKTDRDRVMKLIQTMGINLNIFGEEINDIDGSVTSFKAWSSAILEKTGTNLS